jgi:iron-sulfur cluster assembly protein
MRYADITFTELGAQKVREFLESQGADTSSAGLRLGVRGGGCSVFEDHGLKILVDDQSLPYVHGSSIDYIDQLTGAGFQVNNPNVVAACGCGSSFRVPDEEEVSAV